MSRRRRNASAPRRQATGRQPSTQQRDYGFQDWINLYQSNWQNLAGQWPGFQMTYGKDPAEPIGPNFADYVVGGMQSNGVIFALEQKRIQIFSQVRYQFQGFNNGRPGKLFPKPNLSLVERPWPGGTTSDLNARMLVDADLAGNSFWIESDGDMVRLRPDWVEIVLKPRMLPLGPDSESVQVGFKQIGILYYEGGMYAGAKPAVFLPGEYSHFAPIPDPLATYRGMSWLTPVIREIQADTQATKHKLKFFENAAPQPLDAGILTPSGWSTMGQIRVGSRVIGVDGKPKTVLGVYPQGEQDVYRVTFSCGGSTECTADHLWTVANAYDRKRGVTRTLPLSRLVADGITYDSGPAKWSVPLVDPVEFDEPGELPIDPYLLGSLLGDGSFRSNGRGSGGVSLAAHRDDVDEQQAALAALLPEGVSITRRDRGGWSEFYFKGRGGPRPNPLTVRVRELGLFDKLGYEKSIPDVYLRASVNQRIALLQGLIDTDGNIDRGQPNTVRFDSTSERLARQVGELAGGLGAIASVRQSRLATAGHRAQWRVAITRLPEWIVPCRLARKAALYRSEFRGGRWRYIQSVELVGRKPAQCIKVDTEDHLYVTDAFILTHNTPNIAISLPKEITPAQFEAFVEKMDARHKGADHAYETLYTGGGADVTVVGANMQQLDFKVTQGAGETRLAAAAGIHPVIVGLSEGMQGSSLNSGNYNAAKRSTVDTTFRHLWQNAAGSLEQLVTPPDDISRLWYDARDVPFLHEDQKDAADIQQLKATTITMYVREGFTPESAIAAVDADDRTLLVHTGLVSVQLQPPGALQPQAGGAGPKETAARSADFDWDDDPIGDLDEDSAALLVALGELDHDLSRAFNPALHPRNPKGSPGAGRFRSMVDRLKDAITEHHKNGSKGDPFKGFDREQLRRVAKARGIQLDRGEDRDSIAAKLLADLKGSEDKPAPKPKAAAPEHKPAKAVPTWEELGSPQGPPPVGQPVGYEGGTYELLPGEPRRYRVLDADGRDISSEVVTIPGRGQTADDARAALRLAAFDRAQTKSNTKAGPAKTIAAVPVRWDLSQNDLSAGEDAIPAERRDDVRAALRDWKGWQSDRESAGTHGAEPMVNAVLRGSTPASDRSERDIRALDEALDASRTTRATTVYRGFTDGTFMLPADWQARDLTGVTWREPTFPATSADRDLAETYVGVAENRGFLARIKLPKGSRAVAVTDTDPASIDDEKEIILPRGMTFRVIKDHGPQGELGLRLLDIEVSDSAAPKRARRTARS